MDNYEKRNKRICLIAEGVLAGIFSGLTASLYRLLLMNSETAFFWILNFIKGNYLYIILWFCALLGISFIVARLVRFEGMAASSGVPQVMGEVNGSFNPCWWRILLVKFIGGALCIFSGLSLGRSGPSIQIGAMTAKGFPRIRVHTEKQDKTREILLISCGAGAGLAATFHAPLAGILFVLEGIRRTLDYTVLITGTVAVVAADLVSVLIFGPAIIFSYPASALPVSDYWLLVPLGILLGFAGAGYNYAMSKMQDFYQLLKNIPGGLRLAIPFLTSGILALFLPQVLCGGNVMVKLLTDTHPALSMLCLLLLVKFLFSILCSGSEVPGGIFFPVLVLGSYLGAVFGSTITAFLPVSEGLWFQFILLGMAGLFSAIVRTPITAIILAVELTGSMHCLSDIAIVSILACITANLLGSKPFCTSCLERLLAKHGQQTSTAAES